MSRRYAKSNGKSYTIEESGGKYLVSRGGTKLGSASSLSDAIEIIKADSGSSKVDVRDA
jgi:hypothetical protein